MSYLIAIIGFLLVVPFPVIGGLLVCVGIWMHEAGLASPTSEVGEIIFFYGAIAGIITVAIQ